MRLLRIAGQSRGWTVLAIEDEQGQSVWTWLLGEGSNKQEKAHAQKMRYLMREYVPRNGPPRKRNLGTILEGTGGMCELKAGPEKGPKLRVLYFYAGGEKTIVCTHGFWKASDTAPEQVKKAKEMRRQFEAAAKLTIRDLEPHGKGGPRAIS